LLSLVLCVLLFTLADRSFSRARGPRTPAEQQRWIQEQQRKAEQQRLENEEKRKAAQQDGRKIVDEYSDEAWQQALGATAEQWKAIQPKLEKVKKIEGPLVIRLSVYGFGGGGSSTSSSFSESSGGGGGGGIGGGYASGSAGGSGGAVGGGHYSAGPGIGGGASSASQSSGVRAGGGTSGGQGGSSAGGGAAGSGSGYGFAMGGTGPVKKQVGDVSLGWQWRRPSLSKSPDQLSENEKTCEQLLDVLEKDKPDPEQVHQRVEALRKVREQKQAERREARRQLREVVTPEQEARLVLMGYLD
jgi:hypothetical protein